LDISFIPDIPKPHILSDTYCSRNLEMDASYPPLRDVSPIPKAFASPAEFHEVVNHYRNLRLQGLKLDPTSFSSTYERESQFSLGTWQSRILNPAGRTYVAVASIDNESPRHPSSIDCEQSSDKDLHQLLQKEWVGTATIIGPKTWRRQDRNTTSQPWDLYIQHGEYKSPQFALSSFEEFSGAHLVYLIAGMFVTPRARGKGKGQRLLEAMASDIRKEAKAKGASAASIVIQVEPTAIDARRLYERVGFKVKGKVFVASTECVAMVQDIYLGSSV
jgi:GNAT superfamily N-acetyltransferase